MAMKNIVAFDTLTELQNSTDIRNGMIVITFQDHYEINP